MSRVHLTRARFTCGANVIAMNFLYMRVLNHDKIESINGFEHSECQVSRFCVRPTSKR